MKCWRGIHCQGYATLSQAPGRLAVYYASETLHSAFLAQRLALALRGKLKLSVSCAALNVDAVSEIEQLKRNDLALFVISTFHKGRLPAHAREFWSHIEKRALPLSTQYAVFGRGSSLYHNFNKAGFDLDKKLSGLGALQVLPFQKQDVQAQDPDQVFAAWKSELIRLVAGKYNIHIHEEAYIPGCKVEEIAEEVAPQAVVPLVGPVTEGVKLVKVSSHFIGGSDRSIVGAKFDLSSSSLHYETGDHLLVYSENADDVVDEFIRTAGLDHKAERTILIDGKYKTTYRNLVKRVLDANCKILLDHLRSMAQFSPNEKTKERLRALCDNSKYFEATVSINFDYGKLLWHLSEGVPWNFPASFLWEGFPHIGPRIFSIATSSKVSPHYPQIAVVVEKGDKEHKIKNPQFTCLASGFLLDLAKNNKSDTVNISVQKTSIRLPEDHTAPIVMIGVGTGISPFHAFVQERALVGKNAGKALLIAAVRRPEDFPYRDHFADWQARKLVQVKSVFTRGETASNIYNEIIDNAETITTLIEMGGYLYLSGSRAIITASVAPALREVFKSQYEIDDSQAGKMIKSLKSQGRLMLDT